MTIPILSSEKRFTLKDLSQAHLDLLYKGLNHLSGDLEQPDLGISVDLIKAIKALDE